MSMVWIKRWALSIFYEKEKYGNGYELMTEKLKSSGQQNYHYPYGRMHTEFSAPRTIYKLMNIIIHIILRVYCLQKMKKWSKQTLRTEV